MKKWIIKSEEASLVGTYPGSRSLDELIKNGMIFLDKPPGPTSNQVDVWIKELLNVKKCSHGGTLDPRVSGVLVIALENATKLMPILLSRKKEYVGLVHLHEERDPKKIREAVKELLGKIKQLPPKRSAVARRVRTREIYDLEILEIDKRNILIRVECEAGTYIRRLAEQIGDKLNVKAHLQELRRTRSGAVSERDTITMQQLSDAVATKKLKDVIKPLETVAESMKVITVKDNAAANIVKGSPVYAGGLVRIEKGIEKGDIVGIFGINGEMIGFGTAKLDSEDMNKGLVVKTDRVVKKV